MITCSAYTDAINTGTLPNIQSAWSYVCQNECQRAVQDSVAAYDARLRAALQDAKALGDEQLIGRAHREARELAVAAFKGKAVG